MTARSDTNKNRIWQREFNIEQIRQMSQGCMLETLDIRFIEVGHDYLVATMPVNQNTIQPFGRLHGGAAVALAETVASTGGQMLLAEHQQIVGQEINANHIRAAKSGLVTATGRPLHIGRTSQVWEVHIRDEQQRLTNVARMTAAVIAADGM